MIIECEKYKDGERKEWCVNFGSREFDKRSGIGAMVLKQEVGPLWVKQLEIPSLLLETPRQEKQDN